MNLVALATISGQAGPNGGYSFMVFAAIILAGGAHMSIFVAR